MKDVTIEGVDGGYVVTVQEQIGRSIVSNAFMFNSVGEACAFANSSYATAA